jgi:hypothetical protein
MVETAIVYPTKIGQKLSMLILVPIIELRTSIKYGTKALTGTGK